MATFKIAIVTTVNDIIIPEDAGVQRQDFGSHIVLLKEKNMLNRLFKLIVIICFLFFSLPVFGVPQTLTHQGKIIDSSNTPITGSANVTFKLYTSLTGGSTVWSQTLALTLDDGYYSVELGPGTPDISSDLFDGSDFYLGITLEGQEEFVPRHKVVSTPYSIRSGAVSGEVNAIGGLFVDGEEWIDNSGNLTVPGELTVDGPLNLPRTTFSELSNPSGDNSGQLYYVTDLGVFYYSNGSEWLNLSSGGNGNNGDMTPPTIASISPDHIDPSTNETITINGQNFADGCEVEFENVESDTVIFLNENQVTSESGELEAGTYSVRLTNPIGLRAYLADALVVDTAPEWVTNAGLLGDVWIAATGDHFTLEATDAEGQEITYTVGEGLPPGLSLDPNTGVISGDPDDISGVVEFELTVTATDTAQSFSERTFTINITEEEPAGNDLFIPEGLEGNLLYLASFNESTVQDSGSWNVGINGSGPTFHDGGLSDNGKYVGNFSSSNYIDIPDINVGNISGSYTFIFWYKGTQMNNCGNWDTGVHGFGDFHGSVYIGLGLNEGKIGIAPAAKGSTVIADDEWHMLVFVHKPNNGYRWDGYIDVNGVMTKEIDNLARTSSTNNQYVRSLGYGYPYSGTTQPTAIDGVQVYNTALTPDQIQEIYDAVM